jgi:8-oxo-dGTP pyrophosphatase MutT (NUDIX family)
MLDDRTLQFGTPNEQFLYRVAAIIVQDDRVLAQRIGDHKFLCLPGGRVELGEAAEIAFDREMMEEIGVPVRRERLLWLIENFFTYKEIAYHELGLYFLATLPDGCEQASGAPWTGVEVDGTPLHFQWLPFGEAGAANLNPSFLCEALTSLPEHPQHVLHREK